jgi:hypothetical protein
MASSTTGLGRGPASRDRGLELHRKTNFNRPIAWELEKVRCIFGIAAHQAEQGPPQSWEGLALGWNQRLPAQKKSGLIRTQIKVLGAGGLSDFVDRRNFHESKAGDDSEKTVVHRCNFQPVIPDTEAAQHVGQKTPIEGTVVKVFTSKNGNTFLNFGAAYPNQTFTGWIPKDSPLAGDSSLSALEGKKGANHRDNRSLQR